MAIMDNNVNVRGASGRDQGNLVAWLVSGVIRKPGTCGQALITFRWGGARASFCFAWASSWAKALLMTP
jgi:hypothetical protein